MTNNNWFPAAAWKGDIFALAFLLHEGADRTATDVRGRTALHYAALRGCGPAITSLLEAPAGLSMGQGRTFKRKYLAVTDHDGRTALMAAALSPPLTTGAPFNSSYFHASASSEGKEGLVRPRLCSVILRMTTN